MSWYISHGRSGVVVACILCYIFNLGPQDSLNYTTKCHSRRKNMKDRWRQLGSPQNFNQKRFVYKFFENFNIYKNVSTSDTCSLFFKHPIEMENCIFENAIEAYSNKIQKYTPENNIVEDKVKIKVMSIIIKVQFKNYPTIQESILNTGMKRIIYVSKEDNFWGSGINNTGKNYLGKILMKIRNECFENMTFNN